MEEMEMDAALAQSIDEGVPQNEDAKTDPDELAGFGRQELESLKAAYGVEFSDLEQLAASEKGEQVLRLWSAGAPLAGAWAAMNLDKITAKSAAAAKQSALNAVLGKSHLIPTGGSAAAESPVPTEVYDQYKALLPNFSDSEIRASWQRYRSR